MTHRSTGGSAGTNPSLPGDCNGCQEEEGREEGDQEEGREEEVVFALHTQRDRRSASVPLWLYGRWQVGGCSEQEHTKKRGGLIGRLHSTFHLLPGSGRPIVCGLSESRILRNRPPHIRRQACRCFCSAAARNDDANRLAIKLNLLDHVNHVNHFDVPSRDRDIASRRVFTSRSYREDVARWVPVTHQRNYHTRQRLTYTRPPRSICSRRTLTLALEQMCVVSLHQRPLSRHECMGGARLRNH